MPPSPRPRSHWHGDLIPRPHERAPAAGWGQGGGSDPPRSGPPASGAGRDARSLQRSAEDRLRRFRSYSRLAVALTAVLLLLINADGSGQSLTDSAATEASRSVDQAQRAFGDLLVQLAALLPQIAIAVLVVALAARLTRLTRPLVRRLSYGARHPGHVSGRVRMDPGRAACGRTACIRSCGGPT